MSKLKKQILELRSLGYSYKQIQKKLNCSKGTISYHCGSGQKEKTLLRRSKYHPFVKKIIKFQKEVSTTDKKQILKSRDRELIQLKIKQFHREHKSTKYMKTLFTVEDVIQKFGNNPKCYITGDDIDINKPRTYHFDHIIPRSRGGTNSIDNLGICTKQANLAKSNMTYKELLDFCRKVINHADNNE